MSPCTRHLSGWLFVGVLALYGLTWQGLVSGDAVFHYETARALAQGRLDLPAERVDTKHRGNGLFTKTGRDGKLYLTLAPGLAVLSAPLCRIGLWLEDTPAPAMAGPDITAIKDPATLDALRQTFRQSPSAIAVGLLNPLMGAALATMLFLFSVALGASERRAVAVALTAALGTLLWPYATTFWTQPTVALGLLGALFFAHHHQHTQRTIDALMASAMFAMALAVRFDTILWSVGVLGFFAWSASRTDRPWKSALILALPTATMAAMIAVWNAARFGLPWNTGAYHQSHSLWASDIAEGLLFNALSPNQSLLLFAPAVLLAPIGFVALWRRDRSLTLTLGVLALGQGLFYSAFVFWHTTVNWGPRFLLPTVPLLLLPLATAPFKRPILRWGWAILTAIGTVLSAIGACMPMDLDAIKATHPYYLQPPLDPFWASETTVQAAAMLQSGPNLWWTQSWIALLAGLVLMGVVVASTWMLTKAKPDSQHCSGKVLSPDNR